MSLSDHDVLVKAIVNILSAYSFEVQYTLKGKRTERIMISGDSGVHYYPDFIAKKGLTTLVGDVRTRGQRGTKNEVDRGAVQFMQAELDDMTSSLHRPHGLIVTPWGIDEDAAKVASHFGIYVVKLPLNVAKQIINIDVISDREKIMEIARKNNVVF